MQGHSLLELLIYTLQPVVGVDLHGEVLVHEAYNPLVTDFPPMLSEIGSHLSEG